MKIDNYYLNLDKISKIESQHDREIIHNYYKDMMYAHYEGRDEMATSVMKTLENGGYLIDIRDKKINDILNEN